MSCAICLSNLILEDTIIFKPNTSDFEMINDDVMKNTMYKEINVNQRDCFSFLKRCRRKNIFSENMKLMLTPCQHIFHPECLKLWAEKKNECPVCRRGIPCIED
jgi:hypothetical protein